MGMTKYVPPELREKIVRAHERMKSVIEATIDDCSLESLMLEHQDELDVTDPITGDTGILVSFPQGDSATISVDAFLELDAPGSMHNRRIFLAKNRAWAVIHPFNLKARALSDAQPGVGFLSVTSKDQHMTTSICSGPCPFNYWITKANSYSKYVPPFLEDDLFVNFASDAPLGVGEVELSLNAYLFELSTSAGLDFEHSTFRDADAHFDEELAFHDESEAIDDLGNARIRPPKDEPDLDPLYLLYIRANASADIEFAILTHIKCIEYVSQSAIRIQAHDEIRTRLESPGALNPNAAFLDALINLVEEQKVLRKDSEAIRLTIAQCCDLSELVSLAPRFLKNLGSLKDSGSIEKRLVALQDLSNAVIATRNQMAHAKASYRLTGQECPPAELQAFSKLVQRVAEQAIRWFSRLKPEQRVSSPTQKSQRE